MVRAGRTGVADATDDADALHHLLVEAGVTIVTPLADGPFGRFFTFRDPDGYGITIHTATKRSP